MHRIRRTAVAVTAAAAVALGPLAVGTADARPPAAAAKVKAAKAKAGKVKAAKAKAAKAKANAALAKAQVKQLVHDVFVKDRALANVTTSATVVGLLDDHEAVLLGSIATDRLALATIRDAGVADPATAPATRTAVRAFRVEVYVQAAGIVRDAEALTVAAAENAEALALVDLALQSALVLHARSPKADVEAARALLDEAEALLVPAEEPVEEPVDEPVEEPVS
jgi:peptidoglycan hydrolase-like protein with peptidoglycan-binding domain